jgi:hypothetical protein
LVGDGGEQEASNQENDWQRRQHKSYLSQIHVLRQEQQRNKQSESARHEVVQESNRVNPSHPQLHLLIYGKSTLLK